jgi:hypothetical protein
LIYFTGHQIYFQCENALWQEDIALEIPRDAWPIIAKSEYPLSEGTILTKKRSPLGQGEVSRDTARRFTCIHGEL